MLGPGLPPAPLPAPELTHGHPYPEIGGTEAEGVGAGRGWVRLPESTRAWASSFLLGF